MSALITEAHRDKRATYRKRHADKIRVQSAIWRSQNPHKRKAHFLVKNAIRSGAIAKPTACELCGKSDQLEAHHEDYKKPLDVVWVCKRCHFNLHEPKIMTCEKDFEHGAGHHAAKLTDADVISIREEFVGGISKRGLGRKYGVSDKNIRLILEGKTWKHLNK
jgi:hypothetical protein